MRNDDWDAIASSLDISDSLYDDAVERYQAVGTWLSRDDSALAGKARIQPQGSFALGTVVRPANDTDEYDIDLVSSVSLRKEQITQKNLKTAVGDEIKKYHQRYNFHVPLVEDDFCWTMEYADLATFKMDILPAVPETRLFADNKSDPIAITDRRSQFYELLSTNWKYSDPQGFAAWFRSRMLSQLYESRKKIAEKEGKSVDEIPEYRVKTPLQRTVQILKRHRSVTLQGRDFAPSSMIITTLAALIYDNEPDLIGALGRVIFTLPTFLNLTSRPQLPNPVDPRENLLESWSSSPVPTKLFEEWCRSLQDLLPVLGGGLSVPENERRLKRAFGEALVEQSVIQAPATKLNERKAVARLPAVFQVRHRVLPDWSFRYDYACSVQATAKTYGQTTTILSDGYALPKDSQLEFFVETDAPSPYRVKYQVVNTGSDAEKAGGLRGGIRDKNVYDFSRFVHNERTLYAGPHYIEFFILKLNVCVARSGPFIVNIQP